MADIIGASNRIIGGFEVNQDKEKIEYDQRIFPLKQVCLLGQPMNGDEMLLLLILTLAGQG